MDERELRKTPRSRANRRWIRFGVRLGLAVWALAAVVWFIEADEAVIPIGVGSSPVVATDNDDESIVAWETADSQVIVQSLRMGVTVGTPIRISSVDAAQGAAAAANLVENEFVVAWEEEGETGTGIMARRVRVEDSSLTGPVVPAMGVTVGTPIRVAAAGSAPAVDADEDGNFVVAWTAPELPPQARGSALGHYRHFVALFSRMGVTVGTPIRLGSRGGATPADVARRPDGDSLVVWEDSFKNIRGAIVDETGAVVKDGFRINQLRLGHQSSPAVTVPLDGKYTVVWEREVLDLRFVVGRRIGIDGHGIGGEFLVSLSPSTAATQPQVASDGWGRSYVTWTSRSPLTQESSILGRRLDLSGTVGGESVLASPLAVVSAVDQSTGTDDFIVVWESRQAIESAGNLITGRFVQVP